MNFPKTLGRHPVPPARRQATTNNTNGDDRSLKAIRRRTEQIVRRLLHAFESRDTAAIWSFFADDGVVEFPFIGLQANDFASFDAEVGPALTAAVFNEAFTP